LVSSFFEHYSVPIQRKEIGLFKIDTPFLCWLFFSEGVRAGYFFFLNIIQCESNEKR